ADRGGEQWTDSDRPPGGCIETAEFAVIAESAIGRINVHQDVTDRHLGPAQLAPGSRQDMHRGAQRFPALEGDRHHEPPLVTVPLPLLAVVGAAAAAATMSLLGLPLP